MHGFIAHGYCACLKGIFVLLYDSGKSGMNTAILWRTQSETADKLLILSIVTLYTGACCNYGLYFNLTVYQLFRENFIYTVL